MKPSPEHKQLGDGGHPTLHRTSYRACLLASVLVVSACADGYPQGEGRIVSPVTMSQDQRVEAMNAVGNQHYLGERWRYRLNDVCELKVSTGSWLSRTHSNWVSLKDARVTKSFDKSDKTHDIFLEPLPHTVISGAAVPLVTGANWADAVQLMSLAQYMQRDCVQRV